MGFNLVFKGSSNDIYWIETRLMCSAGLVVEVLCYKTSSTERECSLWKCEGQWCREKVWKNEKYLLKAQSPHVKERSKRSAEINSTNRARFQFFEHVEVRERNWIVISWKWRIKEVSVWKVIRTEMYRLTLNWREYLKQKLCLHGCWYGLQRFDIQMTSIKKNPRDIRPCKLPWNAIWQFWNVNTNDS